MPIWDRDYMREPPPPASPMQRFRTWSITAKLIAANVVVFVLQVMTERPASDSWILTWFANWPKAVFGNGCFWQVITYGFLHAGIGHIFWNMLFLWFFGRELERLYGRANFLWFYLLAIGIGGIAHDVSASIEGTPQIPAIGASAGVMGVVILYAFIYPYHRIYVYFLFPVPIWVLAVVYVAGDLTGMLQPGSDVAHAAHLGGAAVGLAFRYIDLRWTTIFGARRRPRARPRRRAEPTILKFEPREPDFRPDDAISASERERMDALLDRINRDGMDSLSEEEKEFLADVSRKLRERR